MSLPLFEKAAREPFNAPIVNDAIVSMPQPRFEGHALRLYPLLIALDPGQGIFYYNLAVTEAHRHDFDRAFRLCREAAARHPSNIQFYVNFGTYAQKTNRPKLGRQVFRLAIALDPRQVTAWFNLGTALPASLARTRVYRMAIQLNPVLPNAIGNLGNASHDAGQSKLSERLQRMAIAVQPSYFLGFLNLANNYKELGMFDRAYQAGLRSLEINPDLLEARHNLCMLLMLLGRFEEAREHSDARLSIAQLTNPQRLFPQNRWRGENVRDGRVLFWAEQGVGDEIMFASMLREILDRGIDAVLECDSRLIPLFRRAFPSLPLIPRTIPADPRTRSPEISYQCPTADIIHLTRQRPSPKRASKSFLEADPKKVAMFRKKYQQLFPGKVLVGIGWRSTRSLQGFRKSAGIGDLLPLIDCANVQLVNLQYGIRKGELQRAKERHGISIYQDPAVDQITSIDDFAAQIEALDAVVSTSNTTVHVAGALGVPTLVIVPPIPEWRWQLSGQKSLWYRSVEIERLAGAEGFRDAVARSVGWLAGKIGKRYPDDKAKPGAAVGNHERPGAESALSADCYQLARRLGAAGDLRRAVQCLALVTALDPKWTTCFKDLASVFEKVGRLGEARRYYRRSLTLDPRDGVVRHNLILLSRRMGDWSGLAPLLTGPLIPETERLVHLIKGEIALLRAIVDPAGVDRAAGSLLPIVTQARASLTGKGAAPGTDPFRLAVSAAYTLIRKKTDSAAARLLGLCLAVLPTFPSAAKGLLDLTAKPGLEDQGERFLRLAAALHPDDPVVWLKGAKAGVGELRSCRGPLLAWSLRLQPAGLEAWRNLVTLGNDVGDRHMVIKALSRVIALQPGVTHDWISIAGMFNQLDRYEEARRAASRALEADRHHPRALYQLGCALYRGPKAYAEAGAALAEASAIEPWSSGPISHLAAVVSAVGRKRRARALYILSIAIDPNRGDIFSNLGCLIRDFIDPEASIPYHHKAMVLLPDRPDIRTNCSLAKLMIGDFATGWDLYENRLISAEVQVNIRDHPYPFWDGKFLDGALLVWSEQGVGDQIMFAGMLDETADRATRIVLEVDERLVRLFQRSFPDFDVIAKSTPPQPAAAASDIRAQIPSGSLNRLFRRHREAFEPPRDFLVPDPKKVEYYRRLLDQRFGHKRKVGVSWRSHNPKTGPDKSMPIECFEAIHGDDVALISLQYGNTDADRKFYESRTGRPIDVIDGLNETRDLDDLAALSLALDKVVSTSNSAVHIAGAVGAEVCLLAQFNADWRWQVRGDRSLWYPRLRIFRQPVLGDWLTPLAKVKQLLYPAPT